MFPMRQQRRRSWEWVFLNGKQMEYWNFTSSLTLAAVWRMSSTAETSRRLRATRPPQWKIGANRMLQAFSRMFNSVQVRTQWWPILLTNQTTQEGIYVLPPDAPFSITVITNNTVNQNIFTFIFCWVCHGWGMPGYWLGLKNKNTVVYLLKTNTNSKRHYYCYFRIMHSSVHYLLIPVYSWNQNSTHAIQLGTDLESPWYTLSNKMYIVLENSYASLGKCVPCLVITFKNLSLTNISPCHYCTSVLHQILIFFLTWVWNGTLVGAIKRKSDFVTIIYWHTIVFICWLTLT